GRPRDADDRLGRTGRRAGVGGRSAAMSAGSTPSTSRLSGGRPSSGPSKSPGVRLSVRMRSGLTAVQSWTRQGPVWVLSDPCVRRYYYLHDEEYQLLRLLDGTATMQSVREQFEAGQP